MANMTRLGYGFVPKAQSGGIYFGLFSMANTLLSSPERLKDYSNWLQPGASGRMVSLGGSYIKTSQRMQKGHPKWKVLDGRLQLLPLGLGGWYQVTAEVSKAVRVALGGLVGLWRGV